MPGCILRIYGEREAIVLAAAGATIRLEEPDHRRRSAAAHATFVHTVSEADGDQVPVQIRDAAAFLAAHHEDLVRILAEPGVEGASLDFGWEISRNARGQCNRWPIALLSACAAIGIELEVSVYLCERDEPGS